MRTFVATLVVLMAAIRPAAGQSAPPRAEIWAGYSMLTATGDDFPRSTSHGAAAGVAWHLTRWFAVVGEFGAQTNTNRNLGFNFPATVAHTRVYEYMAGAKFSRVTGRTTVVARALVGGAAGHSSLKGFADSGFAMGAGGGVDVRVSPRLAIRGQLDWVAGFVDVMENDWRPAIGLVVRFGR